jgi:hypothetical protein
MINQSILRNQSTAFSINNLEQIVGRADAKDYSIGVVSHATLFNIEGVIFDPITQYYVHSNIDLGTLGGNEGCATSINDSSLIVGYSETKEEDNYYATMFDINGVSLDPNGVPINPDINNNIDINSFLPLNSNLFLRIAWKINNTGQILLQAKEKDNWTLHSAILCASKYTLTIQTEPSNVGINTVNPFIGKKDYYYKYDVELNAANFVKCPDVWNFKRWEGPGIIDPCSPEISIKIDKDKTIIAVFEYGKECGDECHPILAGDLNKDCYVNMSDFILYIDNWLGCTAPECD